MLNVGNSIQNSTALRVVWFLLSCVNRKDIFVFYNLHVEVNWYILVMSMQDGYSCYSCFSVFRLFVKNAVLLQTCELQGYRSKTQLSKSWRMSQCPSRVRA